MSTVKERIKKRVPLEPYLLKEFQKYVNRFDTLRDCADDLGIHFNTIPRILGMRTCSPRIKDIIINKLQAA